MVSVIVTVGPDPAYLQYLPECLESIYQQNIPDMEIVIVDDAAHIIDLPKHHGNKYIKNIWNLGQAASINIGVVSARNDLILVMGGSDDKLLPNCIQACLDSYQEHKQQRWACYSPMIITSEGETSNLPQGVWMFHRSMWAGLGGYPREAAIGEVDAIFCSMMLKQNVVMYPVGNEPLYWHREHPAALGATKSSARHEAASIIRGMCTQEWKKPEWIKGYGYT